MPSSLENDTASLSSIDSFDPPPIVETRSITREQALHQIGDFIHKIGNLEFDQESLKGQVSENMDEPVLRVLPPDLKTRIREWSWHYDSRIFQQISQFINDDILEWEYSVETPNRRKDMPWCGIGADILRFYVADLKPLRKELPEAERRNVVNTVRHGLSLFAEFHDEKVGAAEREAQAAIAGLVLREKAVSD
ncbi:hypothetical protein FLONG3_366 [Fusarium longipes]|uniref:Uncharacterized protein n=1 Tax=Fusarium longipes TaxID=694270 RepID=A0A395TAF7_9HYPO|nr:hypothetical protein FLONG3_366 [Fusarium longipes]